MKQLYRIGSRTSELSVVQTNIFIHSITPCVKNTKFEIVPVKTEGDKNQNLNLSENGGKGLFVNELNSAVLSGSIDIAVHSLKDMPFMLPSGLKIAWYSEREDPRDVIILPENSGCDLSNIKKPIGTSSERRRFFIKNLYPQCQCSPVRGNILTRLKKLDSFEYGALVLAAAAIKRLNLHERITKYFSTDEMLPAASQGILCAVTRKDAEFDFLYDASNREAEYAAVAERSFLRNFSAGCNTPVAAYCRKENDNLMLQCVYFNNEGMRLDAMTSGTTNESEDLGRCAAKIILEKTAAHEGHRTI